jgi:hypothetical protein
MPRPTKKPKDDVEELKTPDYKQALSIYRNDIKPATSKVGEYSQELSTAYKALKKQCRIPGWVAKLAFKLDGLENAKRDVELRALSGLLSAMGIGISRDLIDTANDTETPEVIPTVAARAPLELVTVQ